MVRPITLVFQELAQVTPNPTVPDLNCMIVGPAYQLKDYPLDKSTIQVSDYGTLNANNPYTPPPALTAAIVIAAPPGIVAGGKLDPLSVKVFFDDTRVIMGSGSDGATTLNDNLLTSATATFLTAGVTAGDKLIIDNPVGPATPNLVLTVLSVPSETTLRVQTNFLATNVGTLNWRVERQLDDRQVASNFVVTQPFGVSNEIIINGGITLTVGVTPRVVSYAKVYVQYRAYRTDLQSVGTVNTTNDILTLLGPIDARNPLAAAVSVAKQNAGTAPILFFGVGSDDLTGYNQARDVISTNDEVYAIVPLTTDLAVIAAFKTENEQLADPNFALTNGVPQKFRVVIGTGKLTETKELVAQKVTATTEQVSGAVPPGVRRITLPALTALSSNLRPGDQLILTANSNVAPIDGTYTVAHINSNTVIETNEVFPTLIGAPEGVNFTVVRPSTGATIIALNENRAFFTSASVRYYAKVAGVTAGARTIALTQSVSTPNGIHSIVEVAGVSTVINADFASTNVTAQQIVNALLTGSGVTVPFTGSINITPALTGAGSTVQAAIAATALSSGTAGINSLTSTALADDVFLRLFDASSTFISSGVIPGDIIEMPSNPNGVFSTTVKRFVVDQVLSEQRLQIVNLNAGNYQNNTSTVEYELPHFDNRLGTGTLVTQGSMRYRVVRDLSKTQQVADLVAVAQSLKSRRAILVWPDQVIVSGLVDGSLTPLSNGSAAPADAQPGWYLSAAVGGMTAGLPSQQGFTRLGINGISRIFGSNDYFSESQITAISEGGWYVFYQNTPTSLPYTIHQLTTDPSTLESGEYSLVKNFDFVSLFYVGVLDPFIGIWNINEDTLGFMRQAFNIGTDNLKLRRVARIGAPLIDARITSLAVSPVSADRVEIYANVELPKPLNVIGLHLIA